MVDLTREGWIDGHGAIRALLLGLFLAASAGVLAELLLLEHFEDWEQWIPLALLGVGIAAGLRVAVRPSRRGLIGFRAVMAAFLLAGLVGLYLHYTGNVEFELEMYPDLGGLELVREALTGATPALAPGTMFLLGSVGLVFTYDHPKLRGASSESEASSPGPSTSRHEEETNPWR